MHRRIALMVGLAAATAALAESAVGQLRPTNTSAVVEPASAAAIAQQRFQIDAFRSGFTLSTDGGASWHSGQIDVVVSPCPKHSDPQGHEPCGYSSPQALNFKIRFPAITSAIDVSEPPKHGSHYRVISLAQSPLCTDSFYLEAPSGDMQLSFYPTKYWAGLPQTNTGPDLAVTCQWAVETAVHPGLDEAKHAQPVWSDTVTVRVHGH